MKVNFMVVSSLPDVFPLGGHGGTRPTAKRVSLDPFHHRPLCVVYGTQGGRGGRDERLLMDHHSLIAMPDLMVQLLYWPLTTSDTGHSHPVDET